MNDWKNQLLLIKKLEYVVIPDMITEAKAVGLGKNNGWRVAPDSLEYLSKKNFRK